MPKTYLYRKKSGQVLGASVNGDDAYSRVNHRFFATVEDPVISGDDDFSKPKVFDGSAIRDATLKEIDRFKRVEDSDDNLIDRQKAKDILDGSRVHRKLLKSIIGVLVGEINSLRDSVGLQPISLDNVIDSVKSQIDTGSND